MDFVVVGFGLGALGVLLGVVLLGWLAPRAQHIAAQSAEPDDAAYALAVAAEHRGTGQAFLFAGAAMLLATIGALAGSLDDRTGALLVTTTATVAAIGILFSGYLQRLRNPLPRRHRAASAAETSARAADPAAAESIMLTESNDPGMAEAWVFSLDDDRDMRVDPVPKPEEVPEAKLEAAYISGANGGPAPGDGEPDQVGEVTVTASPGPENGLTEDAPHDHHPATAREEEAEAVVVGYVVPAPRPPDSPTPPARPGDGEDPP